MSNVSSLPANLLFRSWALGYTDCSTEFLDTMEIRLQAVEDFIDEILFREEEFIREAGRYVLKSGGKRLRPLLVLASAQLGEYRGRDDIYLGTLMEFIHTATLVHDDIIDNAVERRGQKALNQVWGNHTAVLLGDYFYTKAMDMALELGDLKILRIISRITTQMLKGEVLGQVHDGNLWMSENQILDIIIRKTACLFSGCCQLGAILAGFPPELENRLADFGLKMGIAFQIVDDILDYTGTKEQLGKPALHDLMEGKITLPFYYLLKRCMPSEIQPFIDVMRRKNYRSIDTQRLYQLVMKYNVVEDAYRTAETFAIEAQQLLNTMVKNQAHRFLSGILRFIIERHA